MTTQTISRAAVKLDLSSPIFEDIPNYATYLARREQLDAIGTRDRSLPDGFRAVYDHASAWSGQTVEPNSFIYNLTDDDVAEIERACESCKRSVSSLNDVNPETFYLPSLGRRLRQLGDEVYDGRGLVLLRGLQPDKFSQYDNVLMYKGVTSYIAPDVGVQGPEKDLLIHVRPYRSRCTTNGNWPTSNALPFHQDFCEVLSLFVVNPAVDGGHTMWASATQVYNELASKRSEVIRVLSEASWPCRRNGVQNNTMLRPILYPSSTSRPLMLFSRRNLTGCYQTQRSASAPNLSDRQIDALDAIHFAAQKHAFSIPQRKGDIILFNNMAVLHARENFQEQPQMSDGESGPALPSHSSSSAAVMPDDRHLMRLWLRDRRRGIRIPNELRHIWEIVYGEESVKKGIWDLEGRHSHSTILNESDASTVG